MSSGRTTTGLRNPNTAGSNRTGEDTTRVEISPGKDTFAGEASLSAVRICHHERAQNQSETPNPHSQTKTRIMGSGFSVGAVDCTTGTADMTTKGIVMSATVEIGRCVMADGVPH